jgi:hypothetical protein
VISNEYTSGTEGALITAMSRLTLSIIAVAALATGCVAHGTGTVGYSASYTATTPDLVYVSPGVQVIADYDEPIFYSDNYYWRHDGGRWYRSSHYNSGWNIYASPPRAVISINNPYRYRRYRPAGYVRRDHRAQPAYRDNRAPYRQPAQRDNRQPYRTQPVVRDHRPQPVYRDNRPARQAPVVRDHRPQPVVRDNRPAPVVRDHRPAERHEKREERRPAPRPVIRDHR